MESSVRLVQIETPDKYLLNGFWFGPEKSRRVFIFVHGLSASLFSRISLLSCLAQNNVSVLTFNNRGYDIVAKIKKADQRRSRKYSSVIIGAAFEKFTDCVFDIQGAVNFAQKKGAKEIILIGHSTGSQKSAYFLSKRGKQKQVKAVVLLSPVSDYASSLKENGEQKLKKIEAYATKLVKKGKSDELLPISIWPDLNSAQRFLSLNTPDSEEEIFCYVSPDKKPKTLKKIRIPTLVVLAEKDEYRDRPIKQIAKWFTKNLRRKNTEVKVIKGADHSFTYTEKEVADLIISWLNS